MQFLNTSLAPLRDPNVLPAAVVPCLSQHNPQAAERKERKDNKHSKRLGEDGIGDDDLQVVSGERDLENLDPKERAKLEKKRGLIRAGMGAAADEAEDTGFEVAKASGAAMAMLGKRYKPKFAVDGLDVQDDREYGSDQVGISKDFRRCLLRGIFRA